MNVLVAGIMSFMTFFAPFDALYEFFFGKEVNGEVGRPAGNRDAGKATDLMYQNPGEWEAAVNALGSEELAKEYFYNTDKMLPGTILITPDSVTLGFMHGHAAIVAEDGITVIEAAGKGKKVHRYPLAYWIEQHKYWTAYVVKGASLKNYHDAAKYAAEYIGKPYTIGLFEEIQDYSVYCSSLVYHSWKKAGITFGSFPVPIQGILPAEIANDPKVVPIAKSEENNYQEPDKYVTWNGWDMFDADTLQTIVLNRSSSTFEASITQELGRTFQLEIYENKSTAPAYVTLDIKRNGQTETKAYYLRPGQLLSKVYIGTPAGEHTIKAQCLAENACEIKGSIRSVVKR